MMPGLILDEGALFCNLLKLYILLVDNRTRFTTSTTQMVLTFAVHTDAIASSLHVKKYYDNEH
jgi:hypothetical protein